MSVSPTAVNATPNSGIVIRDSALLPRQPFSAPAIWIKRASICAASSPNTASPTCRASVASTFVTARPSWAPSPSIRCIGERA